MKVDFDIQNHVNDVRFDTLERYEKLINTGKKKELTTLIEQKLNDDPYYSYHILKTCLVSEGYYSSLSSWLLKQPNLLPSNQKTKDLLLCWLVYNWNFEGIETLLQMGANPNQEVMEGRNLLDICANRADFGCYKELAETVTLLKQYKAVSYLQGQFASQITQPELFEALDSYDCWPVEVITDLSLLSAQEQNQWLDIILHCQSNANKPSKAWLKKAEKLLEPSVRNKQISTIKKWIVTACELRLSLYFCEIDGNPFYLRYSASQIEFDTCSITAKNGRILKGFCWLLAAFDKKDGSSVLCVLAKEMYTKYPIKGIRDTKTANAAYEALLLVNEGFDLAMNLYKNTGHKPSLKKMKACLDKHA
jgi:hypothetical protein